MLINELIVSYGLYKTVSMDSNAGKKLWQCLVKVIPKSNPYNNVLSKNIGKVDIVRINRLHKGT